MANRHGKPVFQSVVDLGLRDVGVRNEPRRMAALLGKMAGALFALLVVSVVVLCLLISRAGADQAIVLAFFLTTMVGLVGLGLHMLNRSPLVVLKVTADGANQAVWLMTLPFLLLAVHALVLRDPVLIPLEIFAVIGAALMWRARGHLPAVLREMRGVLAADEPVLGDGIGVVRGARSRKDAFRLVVATDRRLLIARSTRADGPFLLVDEPYRRVTRFGIEWKIWGRVGELSLTVDGVEEHVISQVAPANLLSIARALESNGVKADDPGGVDEAQRGWEETLWRKESEARQPLLDRAAMSTREFDRGLWLLVGLSAVAFYLNPFGVGIGNSRDLLVAVLLVVPVLCVVCGYASGTRSCLAYLAPLNLLVVPAFFFTDVGEVIMLMFVLSSAAAIGLWIGSALSGERAPTLAPAVARGSLRYALSGFGLVRISLVLLAAVLTMAGVATAAGFELTRLRLAVDEATVKQLPVDGRSNLTGKAAALTYTPGPDLHEFVTDEHWSDDPTDGARWELRSSFTKGYNVISLASYIFEPRLDDPAAVAKFVAEKDDEHAKAAGFRVQHKERVVDGRSGYVWTHPGRDDSWVYAAWFPHPVHSVRVECVGRTEKAQFNRLCAEAVGSLQFR